MPQPEKFLNEMAEILEVGVDSISLGTRFRDIDGWGSMAGFSILITIEEDYGVKIPVADFLKMDTLGAIYAKIDA
jgi:Acyl carrier protein